MRVKFKKNKKGDIIWATEGISVASMGDDYKEADISKADLRRITEKPDVYRLNEQGKIHRKSRQ